MSPNVRPFYGRIIKRRTLQKRIAYFHRQSPNIGLFRIGVADGQSAQQAMQDEDGSSAVHQFQMKRTYASPDDMAQASLHSLCFVDVLCI
jgi:hypothetical protein